MLRRRGHVTGKVQATYVISYEIGKKERKADGQMQDVGLNVHTIYETEGRTGGAQAARAAETKTLTVFRQFVFVS